MSIKEEIYGETNKVSSRVPKKFRCTQEKLEKNPNNVLEVLRSRRIRIGKGKAFLSSAKGREGETSSKRDESDSGTDRRRLSLS